MAQVLVTYGSKYGATREIAEKINEVLLASGLETNLSPIGQVKDPAIYSSVIAGSCVYVGQWHKDAVKFLQNNEKLLSEKKVWLFSSGPTGEGNPVKLVDGLTVPRALKPLTDRIKPRDIAVFHGFINPEKVNFIEKWAVEKVVKKPMGDFRDWKMVAFWADSIAKSLKN